MATKTRTKVTKYRTVQKKASSYCKGKGTKAGVNKAWKAYEKDALKKGKSKADIAKTKKKLFSCKPKKK